MRWIALLRAVNLGKRNKVPMAELRALLDRAGYADVRTYIASGNILLDGPADRAAVAGELQRLIAEEFGVETTAVLRTPGELADVVSAHPFPDDGDPTYVAFLAAEPATELADRLTAEDHGDLAVLSGLHVYLRYPRGFHGARLSVIRLEQLLGVAGTLRNWRTVVALAERACG